MSTGREEQAHATADVVDDAIGIGGGSSPRARWALASLMLSSLLAALGTSVANVGLPTMARELGMSFQAAQWIVLAYLLAITTLIVGAGRLGDMVGRRRLLLVGIAVFTSASLACALSSDLPALIAARAVQGAGAAIMMALAVAMVGDTVPATQFATAMGLLGTTSAVGTALGPSLGGLLLGAFGWEALFLVLVPLGLVTMAIAQRHLPADASSVLVAAAEFDVVGTMLLAVTLGAYSLGMTSASRGSGVHVAGWLMVSGIGGALFLRAQSRASSPMIRLAAFRDRTLRSRLSANALVATVMMATLVVGPFYLAHGLGLAASRLGLVMAVGPLVAALTGVPAGRLADRVGARASIVVGLSAMVSGTILLALPPLLPGIAGYVGPMVLLTAGYALFQTANNAAVMAGVHATERGAISGLLNLSRNLGLVTGASVMGSVYALGAGAAGQGAPAAIASALGLRITFAAASAMVVGAMIAGGRRGARRAGAATTFALLLTAAPFTAAFGQAPTVARGNSAASGPISPYPLVAAGWGPMTSRDRFMSRWAEDWSARRAAGTAPALKAMRLGRGSSLTLSGETRARHDGFTNGGLRRDNGYAQTLFRGTLGADVRVNPHLRVYAELGSGQTDRLRQVASANFQNDASLQQLFLDARGHAGSAFVGAMAGRQEFADGPRQLVSVSDGPNIHRTWNGIRLYAHGRALRVGAFDLRATRQVAGSFDEVADRQERLRGVNASVVMARNGARATLFLDPFWMRTASARARVGESLGHAERSTLGTRLWGQLGRVNVDWTAAHQRGRAGGRDVEAWGLFAVQGITLPHAAWKPRLDLRVDVASGGGTRGSGTIHEFDPLYASSAYVAEGQFLSFRNLVMITPGVSVTPSPRTRLSVEYGVARRYDEREPVQPGGMRVYPGTAGTGGHGIGGLLRLSATHALTEHVSLFIAHEQLQVGHSLRRAGLPSARYGHIGTTLRY